MEWALHIRTVEEIEHLDLPAVERSSPSSGATDTVQSATRAVVDELFGPIQVTRVYLGNEFCERLIPSVQLLERAHTAAAERGLALTLLTPYVTDDGIDRLRPLLSRLEGLAGLAPFAPVAGRGDEALRGGRETAALKQQLHTLAADLASARAEIADLAQRRS
ncbi:MAG: hypothetical protein QGG24_06170, partial [Vicinamibacterales bacterium]|nr:hypothetical protein [Vicinamibacterales bacterium]